MNTIQSRDFTCCCRRLQPPRNFLEEHPPKEKFYQRRHCTTTSFQCYITLYILFATNRDDISLHHAWIVTHSGRWEIISPNGWRLTVRCSSSMFWPFVCLAVCFPLVFLRVFVVAWEILSSVSWSSSSSAANRCPGFVLYNRTFLNHVPRTWSS